MPDVQNKQIPRRARDWPQITRDVIEIPDPPSVPSKPSKLLGVTSGVTFIGVIGLSLLMVGIGGTQSFSSIGMLLLFSILTTVTTAITAIIQFKTYHNQLRDIRAIYVSRLNELWKKANELAYNAEVELNRRCPSFSERSDRTEPLLGRTPQEDIDFWSKRPGDADFLTVRMGTGTIPAPFETKGAVKDTIALKSDLEALNDERKDLIEMCKYVWGPVTTELTQYSCVAILTDPGDVNSPQVGRARELLRGMAGQVAYHCSPDSLTIWAMAPETNSTNSSRGDRENPWSWMTALPHAAIVKRLQEIDSASAHTLNNTGLAIGETSVNALLTMIAHEVDARKASLRHKDSAEGLAMSHLLVLVDYFPPESAVLGAFAHTGDLLSASSAVQSAVGENLPEPRIPIRQPALASALTEGIELSITTICICTDRNQAPEGCQLLIDLRDAQTRQIQSPRSLPRGLMPEDFDKELDRRGYQALIRHSPAETRSTWCAVVTELRPDPGATLYCKDFDQYPVEKLQELMTKLRGLTPVPRDRIELPERVDFRLLYPFLQRLDRDYAEYDPRAQWLKCLDPDGPLFKPAEGQEYLAPVAPIPIGFRLGQQPQYLNLNNEADRAHGMIAGQTGAGKSVLLQTIITSFAVTHPPEYMNFLLVDFKSGLALDRFKDLPHTIGFLTNVATSAQIERFVTMVRAEKDRRGRLIRELKQAKAQPHIGANGASQFEAGTQVELIPRLLIVVDEFAEMASLDSNSQLIEDFISVLRLGRELGMHLLVTGQRPEGKLASRVMDLVQYRMCLRTNDDDSKVIIGRRDAADLPASIQGRCYMLHGDNQLDLFQAATVQIKL